MTPAEFNALLARRSEPTARAVLEDHERERGSHLRWLAWPVTTAAAAAADAADAAADAAAAAAAAAAADADDIAKTINHRLREEPDMREGLKLIQIPGRWGYAVTIVGWLRRREGDEWDVVNGVTIVRAGAQVPLRELAAAGPGRTHQVQKAPDGVEELHRLLIRRSIPADEKAWATYCPKPADWEDR